MHVNYQNVGDICSQIINFKAPFTFCGVGVSLSFLDILCCNYFKLCSATV